MLYEMSNLEPFSIFHPHTYIHTRAHKHTPYIHFISIINVRGGITFLQTYNISRTLVNNKIVDHSDVVEASPVGAAST